MAKAIHMMIRVLDEARSVSFYDKAFGLKIAERIEFPNFTLVYLSNDEAAFEIELTINKGRTTSYEMGDAYGHVAFTVDDLDREHARFQAAGLSPRNIVELNRNDRPFARLFFVDDPDGYKVEVLQRRGRYI